MAKGRNKKSGVALLLVLVTLFLMSIMGYEILFSANVEARISSNARNRLQATYLAQSALRFSLLRLYLYKEARNMADKNKMSVIPDQMIDKIWSERLPQLPLSTMKVSWPGEMQVSILSEGSKIPINLLDANKDRRSDDDKAKSVREQIMAIFKGLSEDEEFDKQYRGLEAKELVDNIKDWVDADDDKEGGGDETSDYQRFQSPYLPRNDRLPVLSELHMIKGWNDDLVKRVAVGNFSVFNTDIEVSPNYISRERLKAQCPDLSNEDLNLIVKKRGESPFKSLDELFAYIQGPEIKNGRNCQKGPLLDLVRESNFVVEGAGIVGRAVRKLKVYVRMTEDAKPGTAPPSPSPTPTTPGSPAGGSPAPAKPKSPLGDPRIIFVEESV